MSAFRVYWIVYGGWKALLLSPYLLLSGVFWAFCKPIWYDGKVDSFNWTDWSLSLLASMIAFSLGALAIFLALSNEKFLNLLRQGGVQDSFFMSVVVAFFHFIIVQFAAIGLIVLVIAYKTVFLSGVAFWAFCYAMACGIAAAAALVDTADILNMSGDDPDE